MSDEVQSTPLTNAAAAIEKAKTVADRYKRQVGFLIMLNTRLPIIEAALEQRTKDAKDAVADVERLTLEVAAARKHIDQLTTWVAKNQDMPDDVAVANALAEKIRKLQKDIEKRQRELHRMEAGLPELDDK